MHRLSLVAFCALLGGNSSLGVVAEDTGLRREVSAFFSDAQGRPLTDILAEEIAVSDGGVTRQATLQRDTRPINLALVVDSSEAVGSDYRLHFVGGAQSLISALPEGTRLSVWVTGDRPQRLMENEEVETGTSKHAAGLLSRVPVTGGNTILDAVVEAGEALERNEGERKVLVFISGSGIGFAAADRQTVAQRARQKNIQYFGALVSSSVQVVAPSSDDVMSGDDYDYALGEICRESGGRFERPLSAMGVARVVQDIVRDVSSTYRISWDAPGERKGRLKVRLELARTGAKIRHSAPRTSNVR